MYFSRPIVAVCAGFAILPTFSYAEPVPFELDVRADNGTDAWYLVLHTYHHFSQE